MATHDRKFMDLFTLIMGVLIATAVGLGLLAAFVASRTQNVAVRDNPEYQHEVDERLKPVGTVVLAGQESPAGQTDATPVAAIPAPVAAPLSGPQVFNQACNACHGAGIAGAPKLGDKADWGARIAQGVASLERNAIAGFQGKKGVMPAKGGFVNLSDAEVRAAVAYMLAESR